MSSSVSQATPRYPRVIVDVDPDQSDVVASELFDLGCTGVEERDEGTLELASTAGRVTLVASFEEQSEAIAAVAALPKELNPRLDEVVGDEWRDAWKEQFKAFSLSPSLVVCPPWETCTATGSQQVLVLEPGRAFGTGLHATTSLMVEAIERHKHELTGREILDVGAGTGILAFAALLLGASRARATDNDPESIPVLSENAERNGLGDRIVADTNALNSLQGSWPVIVANIEARVLTELRDSLVGLLDTGGLLLLSGILEEQKDFIVRAYAPLTLEAFSQRDEWVVLEFRKAT